MNEKAFTNHAFHEFLGEHKLMGSRCVSCDAIFIPPRPMCPNCHSDEMEWMAFSGQGTLAAYTAVHIGLTRMIEAGYDRKTPYVTGVVQLEEGPMISAQILGVDATQPAQIAIGAPLEVAFIEQGEGEEKKTYLAFKA